MLAAVTPPQAIGLEIRLKLRVRQIMSRLRCSCEIKEYVDFLADFYKHFSFISTTKNLMEEYDS